MPDMGRSVLYAAAVCNRNLVFGHRGHSHTSREVPCSKERVRMFGTKGLADLWEGKEDAEQIVHAPRLNLRSR